MNEPNGDFEVIELSMMNKQIFLPLSGLGSFTVQTLLYPLVLLRIRLQLQEGVCVYRGLIHATASILREEGIRGLYSGYFVKTAQLLSTVVYASTYESVRHAMTAYPNLSPSQRSFMGGAAASLFAQTLVVPIDIVSQHLMVLPRLTTFESASSSNFSKPAVTAPVTAPHKGPIVQPIRNANTRGKLDRVRALSSIQLNSDEYSSSWSRFRAVINHITQTHGLRGFYNGYLISLCTFVPSSALWWAFYDKFCRTINATGSDLIKRYRASRFPTDDSLTTSEPLVPRLPVQLISGSLAGITAATAINPMDCIRVRMQVGHTPFQETVRTLWMTEGFRWFGKGLSARILQSSIFSFWLVLIYEPVKMFCLKDEFRDQFRARDDGR